MKNTPFIFIAVVLFSAVLMAFPALAQQSISFQAVEVALWPEYDKPDMLVIIHMQLPQDLQYPVEVSFNVPATAEIHAVAYQQDGQLFTLDAHRELGDEWTPLVFNAPYPDIQVEYYDPRLTKEGTSRTFVYTWPGGYPVESFRIEVQEPVDTQEMRIYPSLGSVTTGTDSLVYHRDELGSLSADQDFSITVEYEKTSDTLSMANLSLEPVEALSGSGAPQGGFFSNLPWTPILIGVLGVLLIVGGAVWYWRSGQRPEASQPRRRRSAPGSRRTVEEQENLPGAEEGSVYCHQCGKRAAPGDRFCRVCGTRLRT